MLHLLHSVLSLFYDTIFYSQLQELVGVMWTAGNLLTKNRGYVMLCYLVYLSTGYICDASQRKSSIIPTHEFTTETSPSDNKQ